MKCFNQITVSRTEALNIDGIKAARETLTAQIDAKYCAERFGSINALDLLDEDFHYEIKENHGRNNYTLQEIVGHLFSYMQLSSSKLACNDEVFEKYRVCNLFDVDHFIIQHNHKGELLLNVVTDYEVEGSSIEAFNLTFKDIQQLNVIAQIAVLDFIVFATSAEYSYNESMDYDFTSHLKNKKRFEL